jgi:peptide deformylase
VALLEILTVPDPRLKQVSAPVEQFDDELRAFIQDLEQTMRAAPGGIGIAAPQVARFQRIVFLDLSAKPKVKNHGRMVLINPEITHWDGMAKGREGCMSVPDYTGNVIRAEHIKFIALDEFGQQQQFECEGFEARAVQHEVDHLDGILFIDRLVSRRTDLFERKKYK